MTDNWPDRPTQPPPTEDDFVPLDLLERARLREEEDDDDDE